MIHDLNEATCMHQFLLTKFMSGFILFISYLENFSSGLNFFADNRLVGINGCRCEDYADVFFFFKD